VGVLHAEVVDPIAAEWLPGHCLHPLQAHISPRPVSQRPVVRIAGRHGRRHRVQEERQLGLAGAGYALPPVEQRLVVDRQAGGRERVSLDQGVEVLAAR